MDTPTVDSLIDGYQRTLASARDRFGDGLEARLVVAAVTENARAARQTLVTAVEGGDALVGRLDTFLDAAQEMDIVGQWLARGRSMTSNAVKEVRDWVIAKIFGLATPPVAAAVVGAALSLTDLLRGFGEAVGSALVLILLIGLSLISRYPPLAAHVIRIGGAAGKEIAEWSGDRFDRAVRTADNVGRGAEKLLNESLAESARAIFGNRSLPGWEVPGQVRSTAKGLLYFAVGVIVVCLIVIGFGIAEGFSSTLQEQQQDCFQTPRGPICF